MNSESLFERFGGDSQLKELIDQFYYKVLFDKNLRGHFLKADMTRVRKQQQAYFAYAMGSKEEYKGRPLTEVHQNLKLQNSLFDAFVQHMHEVLKDMEKTPNVIAEVLMIMQNQRQYIIFE